MEFIPLSKLDLSPIEDLIYTPDGRRLSHLKTQAKKLKKAQPGMTHAEALLTMARGSGLYGARDWSQAVVDALSYQVGAEPNKVGLYREAEGEPYQGYWLVPRDGEKKGKVLANKVTTRGDYLKEAMLLDSMVRMDGYYPSYQERQQRFLTAVKQSLAMLPRSGYVMRPGVTLEDIESIHEVDLYPEKLMHGALSSGEWSLAAALSTCYNSRTVADNLAELLAERDQGDWPRILDNHMFGSIAARVDGESARLANELFRNYHGW